MTIIRHCKTEAVVMLKLDRTLPIAGDCLATVEPWESPFGSRQRMIIHSDPYLQRYLANQLTGQKTPHPLIPLTQSNGSATFLRVVDAIELVHTEPTLWHIPGRQYAAMDGPEGRVTAYIAEGPRGFSIQPDSRRLLVLDVGPFCCPVASNCVGSVRATI